MLKTFLIWGAMLGNPGYVSGSMCLPIVTIFIKSELYSFLSQIHYLTKIVFLSQQY